MSYVAVMFPENRIRELRKSAGLTQTELGEKVGLHQTQIGNLENGGRNLTFEWARRIAKALGVHFADLLSDADNPDRLNAPERELVRHHRAAPDHQKEMIERVAEPSRSFRGPMPEEEERRHA